MLVAFTSQFINGFILGGVAGFVIGFGSSLYLSKENLNTEKRVSIFLLVLWALFHVWGIYKDIQIPYIFDIIAGGGAGNLYGLSVSSLIDVVMNKWKK